MPRLWTETIESHRREVRDAILDAAASLLNQHGMLSLTMSQIAEKAGIGRATLYKYFPDVEAVVLAWHERGIAGHLHHLAHVRDAADPGRRLEAVLEAYALIDHEHHGSQEHRGHLQDKGLVATLHSGGHVVRAENELLTMIRALIAEAAQAGIVRDDIAPAELASYCLHSLSGASSLPSKAAVRRLVGVTLAGLRTPS